jgi:hypothetical protein
MSTGRIGRRELIKGAGAGAVAVAALTLPATSASAERERSRGRSGLLGGWLLTVKNPAPDNGTTKATVTFGAGGDLATVDISPPGPAGLGTWRRGEESGDFALTFWAADSDQQQNPGGTVKIHATGSLDGDEISGDYTIAVFLGNGTQVFTGSGTFSGSRIEA